MSLAIMLIIGYFIGGAAALIIIAVTLASKRAEDLDERQASSLRRADAEARTLRAGAGSSEGELNS